MTTEQKSEETSTPAAEDAPPESKPKKQTDLGTAMSWTGSVLLHGILILLGFVVTWVVIQTTDDEPPPVVSSTETETPYEAIHPLETINENISVQNDQTTPTMESREVEAEEIASLTLTADSVLAEAAALNKSGIGESSEGLPDVRFGGVRAPEAKRIIFIVDASGSMIGAFPTVIDQLERSLRALKPKQSYGILLFQEASSIEVPPKGRLHSAQDETISRSIDWILDPVKGVTAQGRSNPTAAFKRAFNLDPDVIFVVSTDITGSGEFEIDKKQLLATLDQLNPKKRSGHRAVRIRCIQLLDDDPLEMLKTIATEHGGAEGYAFISREQLGLAAPR